MKNCFLFLITLIFFINVNISLSQTPYDDDKPFIFTDYSSNVYLYISPNKAGSKRYNLFMTHVFYKSALLNERIHYEFFKERVGLIELPKEFTYSDPFNLVKYKFYFRYNVSKKRPYFCLNKNIMYCCNYIRKVGCFPFAIIRENEFRGKRFYIWESQYWNDLEKLYKGDTKDVILSVIGFGGLLKKELSPKESYDIAIRENSIIVIDSKIVKNAINDKELMKYDESLRLQQKVKHNPHYEIYMNKLLKQSSQPIASDISIEANVPIMLVDEINHKNRVDSDDWRIYAYMNNNNGDFFQYFFFEKEIEYEWPLYVRDIALDHLAGAHICKKSTVLVNKKSHEKLFKQGHMRGNNPKDVYISKTKGKQWRPESVPEDKNTIPKDRLFFDREPGRIFGSYAKVWELDVWQMLPNMLKDNPEGVYLIGYGTLLHLNECKTPYEEQALLKKCGVLITPQIYKELQSLHRLEQSKSETKTDSK